MTVRIRFLAAAAALGALAVPAIAQTPYPYGYQQQSPQPYPGQPGYGYQQGYAQNPVSQIINSLLGNRYNVNDRQAVTQCASAAMNQAAAQNSNRYRPGYGNNLNRSLTRSFDLSGYSGSVLRFDDRCDTEANWDFGNVEISVNGGGNWIPLGQCSGRTTWQANRIVLPASTDNLADLRLRFRLSSDGSVTRSGWAIDNIVVESGGSECRASQLDVIFADGFE